MSDLARAAPLQALAPLADPQPHDEGPPAAAYCDAAVHAREQACLFPTCARYVGHEQMVPEVGDWCTLAHEQHGRVLVRRPEGVALLSNVCRHRQALLLGEPGGSAPQRGRLEAATPHIVCPLHRWTYDRHGVLVGAPHFDRAPCRHLERFALKRCQGLLFEGRRDPERDLAPLFARPEFDFSDYTLDHVEVLRCRCNWKTFIEIYNDDYHIGPFHPGLGRFVRCEGMRWEFGEEFCVQRVGTQRDLREAGSPAYREWHERLLAYRQGEPPPFGAIWVTYYPTHMIEVFPHALVLSTAYPVGPAETVNTIEFHYPQDIVAFEPELARAHRTAYLETAQEDDAIAERIDAGRRALHASGRNDSGPYQAPMEDGMRHFHAWYVRKMAAATAPAASVSV